MSELPWTAAPGGSPAGQHGPAESQRPGQWQHPDPYRAGSTGPAEADWASPHDQARAARWGRAEDLSRVAQRGGWGIQPGHDSQAEQSPAGRTPRQAWAGYREDESWPDDREDQPFEQAGRPAGRMHSRRPVVP